ncbi:MAG: prepilin-type N-terminal cleavage/methylation domain-containing protein [Gemmataceae bacterium]|nr:prepilin-type N-terminal cleavage/methylation domain-containing protein [Gemmataceae bacterium]
MKRHGTTLIEVLAAIFILALGLVALMTLFPLGAAQMARSIQDERAAQIAGNAASYFRWYWRSQCEPDMMNRTGDKMLYESVNPSWYGAALDDPNAGVPNAYVKTATNIFPAPANTAANISARSRSSLPSYPVFIDPVGWMAAGASVDQYWVGEKSPTVPPAGYIHAPIPRRTIVGMTTLPQVLRMFSMLDDMGFDTSGVSNVNERSSQYSYAWLLRRNNSSLRQEVNLTVVVYFRRSLATLAQEANYVATVNAPATTDGTTNTVTLHYTGERPSIRRGSWILDASMGNIATGVVPQGFYYRVTEVGEPQVVGSENTIDLQVETPLKFGPSGAKSRVFVVQDRVLEVFDKGTIDMTSPPRVN